MPLDVIKAKRAPYRRHGKPWHRSALQNLDDYDIVQTYGAEYRGIVGYYLLAADVWRLGDLHWHALTSMLKTLAAKHQSTVSTMAAKYQAKIQTRYGLRRCFEARIHRDGKPDLVARFGGIPLVRDKDAVLVDRVPGPAPHPRKELIHRLLTRRCELCGEPGKVMVHQVRKLANLGRPGQANPRGRRSWRPSDARPSWSAPPATTSSTPTPSRTRHRSLESHVPGKGPAWFGGGPRGKGVSTTETTSPCGLSCPPRRRHRADPQPVPAGSVPARPPGARAPQPDGAAPQRADRAVSAEGAQPGPAQRPGRGVQRDLRAAALASGPGAGRLLRLHRGAGLGAAVDHPGRGRPGPRS